MILPVTPVAPSMRTRGFLLAIAARCRFGCYRGKHAAFILVSAPIKVPKNRGIWALTKHVPT